MFESADLDHSVPKAAYKREEPKLREGLLEAQFELKKDARFAVAILIAGVQGAGRRETGNLLNEWMDPRHEATYAFGDPTQEEREQPEQWRFWRLLAPTRRLRVLYGPWPTGPIQRRQRKTGDGLNVSRALKLEQPMAKST